MANKRDLLKKMAQQNEQNRGAESVLTETSAAITTSSIAADNKIVITPVEEAQAKNITEKEQKENKTNENELEKKSEVEVIDISPSKPSKPNKEKAEKKVYSGTDKNFGMRLCCDEDIDFLNFYPIQLGMTKKTYFLKIMEKAINEAFTKEINRNDPLIMEFMKGGSANLGTKNVTIAIPEDMIADIKKAGAKYRMLSQRYVAYVVHKARLNAKDYE